MDLIGVGKAISGAIDTVADKFFVDAKDKEAFKLQAIKMQQDGEFKNSEIKLSAILAEAKSKDPWTSRARPSFLYVMYILILGAIPMGLISAYDASIAVDISTGMKEWLAAIPQGLWATFGIGYSGYTVARSAFDKKINK